MFLCVDLLLRCHCKEQIITQSPLAIPRHHSGEANGAMSQAVTECASPWCSGRWPLFLRSTPSAISSAASLYMGAGLPSSLVDFRAGPAEPLGLLGPEDALLGGCFCLLRLSTQALSCSFAYTM